jgi:GrpB-like predicted nucleotidyltransferase (UPF0157 family)
MITIISCIVVIILVVLISENKINNMQKIIEKQREDILYRNNLLLELVEAGEDLMDDFIAMQDVLEDSFGEAKAYEMFVKRKKRNEEGSDINDYLKDVLEHRKDN